MEEENDTRWVGHGNDASVVVDDAMEDDTNIVDKNDVEETVDDAVCTGKYDVDDNDAYDLGSRVNNLYDAGFGVNVVAIEPRSSSRKAMETLLVESANQPREGIREILLQVANQALDVVCRRRKARRRQKEFRLFSEMEDPWWSGGLTNESIRQLLYEMVVNQSFKRYERRERARNEKERWKTDHLMEVEDNNEQEGWLEVMLDATTD